MNYIDMFIVVLLVYAVFKGFTNGFIMQLTLLAALLLGIFGALKLSGFTARQLENHVNLSPDFIYIASLGITFLLVFVAVYLVGKLTEKLIKAVELSFVNRLLGVLFGVSKIVLILGILLSYIDRIDQKVHLLPEGSREHSIFFKPFTSIVQAIFPSIALPESPDEKKAGEFV
jgi:membrane protein required for colicin V production